MKRETLRNGLIIVYMVGNALTFNALLKLERATMAADQSWTTGILKILALAIVWPVYWLFKLFT
jgi:hypothetical protein